MLAMKRFLESAAFFDPRGESLAVARSLLAMAQLSFILFAPDRDLLFAVPHPGDPGPCGGVDRISLWCVGGGQPSANLVARVVAVAILTAVVLGLRPRWLCIPHWYIAFSVIARLATTDGGSAIAVIACGLIIPQSMGDSRSNHWRRTDQPLAPTWRGSSYAAHLVLRAQVAIIYLDAALSKARHPAWRNGRALRIIMQDPQYGAPDLVRSPIVWILKHGYVGQVLTWSVMIIELGISVSMFCATVYRRYALVVAIAFHLAIMIFIGLFSFALIMIAVVTLASLETSLGKEDHHVDGSQSV
ncbi:antimicrobial peptide system SdpB family protein [Catenulispora sp. EB89]|uniref:sporulation-delaying protein SdpB family protein n=1 Tax=Catenulispora sp. EB89 TaxID=3156257 RepID=UPI0035190BD6